MDESVKDDNEVPFRRLFQHVSLPGTHPLAAMIHISLLGTGRTIAW